MWLSMYKISFSQRLNAVVFMRRSGKEKVQKTRWKKKHKKVTVCSRYGKCNHWFIFSHVFCYNAVWTGHLCVVKSQERKKESGRWDIAHDYSFSGHMKILCVAVSTGLLDILHVMPQKRRTKKCRNVDLRDTSNRRGCKWCITQALRPILKLSYCKQMQTDVTCVLLVRESDGWGAQERKNQRSK